MERAIGLSRKITGTPLKQLETNYSNLKKAQLAEGNQLTLINKRGQGFELGEQRTNPESGKSRTRSLDCRIASPTC